MSHMMHFDGSRPPPTPREMYAEGMYASIEEQGHYDHKKQAPPPPKRDPNTRLSSSSQMAGMNNYQEIEVHETSHAQYHGSHHQQHHQQQQSHHHHQQESHHHHQQQSQHHHQQQYYQQQQYSDHHSQQQQQQQQLKYSMQQLPQHHSSQQHQYSSQQQHSMQMQHMQQHHQQYYSQQKQQQTQQHPIQQQHMKYDQQQQSPRHTAHDSPTSRSKFTHEPQSPSHSGDKPFSYGITMSPKLNRLLSSEMKHTSQNGNGHTQQTAPMSPTRGDYQREESPVMSYGKHESTFPSQAHRPPPHGPPPPVPQQGSPSPKYPSSPVLPRHSVTSIPNNSRIQEPPRPPNPKLSQRSMSVPCNNNGAQQSIVKPQPVMSAGFGYNGMGHPAHRTPSPPLPPPPPELMDEYSYQTAPHQQQYHHNQPLQPTQMLSQMPHGAGNQALPNTHSQSPPRSSQPTGSRSSQAPPPPPLNLIPRKQTNAPTNISTQNVKACTERSMKGNYPLDVNGNAPMEQPHRGKSHSPSGSPMRGSIDSNADQTGLLQQISKVQLKKTGGRQSSEEGSVHEEVQQIPPQTSPQSLPVSKDSSPTQETEVIPVNSAVDMFEKKVESVIKEENRLRRKGDTSKNSGMDFNIDDIDLGDVPGYTPITKSTPIWKRDMIEKKNQEKIEEYIAKKRKEKEDAEKWKHVPAWKRKLMMEKEKEKEKKSEAELKQPATSPTPPKTTPATPPTPPKKAAPSTPAQPKIAPATPTQPKKARAAPAPPKKAAPATSPTATKKAARVAPAPPKKAATSIPTPTPQKTPPATTPTPPKTSANGFNVDFYKMKEEEELRKAKLKEQKEMEKQMDEELQDVPAWKKEIMMKRGGAIKNWADERETINEQELDGENRIENSDEMYDIESLPPPPPSPPPDHHHPHHYVEPEPQVFHTSNAEEPTPTPTQPPPSQQTQQTQQSKASVVLKPQLPKDPPEAKKTPKPAYIDESKLEDEWDSLPLWKREIMMKRGGAPTNWGDEREDKNEEGVEQ